MFLVFGCGGGYTSVQWFRAFALVTFKPTASRSGIEPRLTCMPDDQQSNFRILCVDDHADTLLAMSKLLEHRGYEVATACGYGDALRKAHQKRFDVLIADVGLPDGNGLDLLSELQSLYPIRGVVVSGYAMQKDVEQALTAGYAVHVPKPIDVSQLFQAIERLCRTGAGPVQESTSTDARPTV